VSTTVIDRLARERPAGNPCDARIEELTPREPALRDRVQAVISAYESGLAPPAPRG
jgi:hypothetical protein